MPGSKPPEFDIRSRCEFYAQKYHRRPERLEKGLAAYAVHLFAQEPGFDTALDGEATTEADLAAHLCQSNDLHIDAMLEDEVGRRLLLIHAAWRHKDLDERRIAAFFDAPDRILSHPSAATGGDQIPDLPAGFAEKVDDGYEILLRFVTNLPAARRAQLAIATEAKNQAYENTGRPIRCEVYGVAELSKREDELGAAVGGGLVEPVTLNLQSGHFTALDAPFRTLVGVIKANELVDLYNRAGVGNTLFHLDIRPLGSRRANPKIVATALSDDEAAHFFYYNNGVSAICTEYILGRNTVTAKRFQIVDGARTVTALARALHRKPNAAVYLLFRLTAAADSYGGPFTDSVVRYTNTQNSVKVPTLFSDDPIQRWLRENFTLISGRGPVPAMYYRHRSGHRSEDGPGKGITIEQLAGIRHAFLYGPVPGYREPAQFFDRELRYAEAFGINGREVDRWAEEELFETAAAITINQRVQEISRSLATDSATKDTDEARYLRRLARYVTALVGVGLEAVRPWTFHDYATLTASAATFDQHVNPMVEKARAVLRHEFTARTIGPAGGQPEYQLARDEPTWARLRDTLRQQVLAGPSAPSS
jgi:AIPR protein